MQKIENGESLTSEDYAAFGEAVAYIQHLNAELAPIVADLGGRLDRIAAMLPTLSDGEFSMDYATSLEGMVSAGAHGRVSLPDLGPLSQLYVGFAATCTCPWAPPATPTPSARSPCLSCWPGPRGRYS